jgi:FkbH-like protein
MSQSAPSDPMAVLSGPAPTLRQTMEAVEALERSDRPWREAAIGLSANVTIELLGVFLRKHALLHGVRLKVAQGNFDDPEGDLDRFRAAGIDQMLLLPFFDNLLPSFEAQAAHLPVALLEAKASEFRSRYRLLFQRASAMKTLFLGTLHRRSASVEPGGDRVDELIAQFNQALRQEAAPYRNIRWLDTGASLRWVGQEHSFDSRFYFSAKAPYSTAFLNDLARRLVAGCRGFGSYFHKALVLDGDNTLWGGVVGEDLLEGIQLGPHEAPGSIFWQVQNELLALEQRGVLLCLCSKNNPGDVAEVLEHHPGSVLHARNFILQKVNWQDKPANLREIAEELNLGLDSLVFLDDSPFECEAVRTQLPAVRTFQVPARLSEYPALLGEIKELFLAGGLSADGRSRTEQYRQRAMAEDLKAKAASQEEYLASLGLKVNLARNGRGQIRRISELSLKSNQFNLTTRRYSEMEVQGLMESPDHTVYALSVSDRFGDAGLTGVLVMHWQGATAQVEAFFMSCRVIGRGIETAIWGAMLEDARSKGCRILAAEYRPTPKNAQVASFFDGLGLPLVEASPAGLRRYQVDISSFTPPRTDWIEVSDVG